MHHVRARVLLLLPPPSYHSCRTVTAAAVQDTASYAPRRAWHASHPIALLAHRAAALPPPQIDYQRVALFQHWPVHDEGGAERDERAEAAGLGWQRQHQHRRVRRAAGAVPVSLACSPLLAPRRRFVNQLQCLPSGATLGSNRYLTSLFHSVDQDMDGTLSIKELVKVMVRDCTVAKHSRLQRCVLTPPAVPARVGQAAWHHHQTGCLIAKAAGALQPVRPPLLRSSRTPAVWRDVRRQSPSPSVSCPSRSSRTCASCSPYTTRTVMACCRCPR